MHFHRFQTPLLVSLFVAMIAAFGSGVLYYRLLAQEDMNAVGAVNENGGVVNGEGESVPAHDAPVTMLAVGDLMLGRSVETAMKAHGDAYIFAKAGDLFKGYDLVFGNFEGTAPVKHVPTPPGSFRFNFRQEVVPLLAAQGFDVVSLANNHALDFGQVGFEQTAEVLEKNGIAHVGHYSNEQQDVYETEIRGKKIVMVAFNVIEYDFDEKAAVAWAKKAAEKPHDVLLASVHWGNEYVNKPGAAQRHFAEGLIDAGVDVVLGGHPHVPQSISTYKGKTIIYSMGNFVFDQYWSEATQLGMAVALTFEDERIVMRPIPIDLHKSQPRAYEESRVPGWRGWMAGISDELLREMIKAGEITQKME